MAFENFDKVQEMFPDEDSARKYLIELRWGKFASCPYCGNDKCYKIKERDRLKCASPLCKKKFSVTVKSLLEDTKIPTHKWVWAFYLFAKTRGRISSFELSEKLGISHKAEFFTRERLEFAWQFVNREGKSIDEIMKDFFVSSVHCYDRFFALKHEPYYNNPHHISEINDISDPKQYNQLVRYISYYVNVYCTWIFMDFAKPQEILTETFLWMRDNDILEYNADSIIKHIQKTVNKMWFKFLKEHPKYSGLLNKRHRFFRQEARINLSTSYIIELIAGSKKNNMTRAEIRADKKLIAKKKADVIKKRKATHKNYDFHSHFS